MNAAAPQCFLCQPDTALVYSRSEHFLAMLGHGPLGEGYSLIATIEHVPSMLDLEADAARRLTEFTNSVRELLRARYGESVITEHGRVAACVAEAIRRYEPHCLHAHRLVFPGQRNVDLATEVPTLEVTDYRSFLDAWHDFSWPGEYLYVENPDRRCALAPGPRRLPRQLFRTIIARHQGQLQAANWQQNPRLDVVEAARQALGSGR